MRGYETMIVVFIDILGSKNITSFEEKYKIHDIFHNTIKQSNELQSSEAKSRTIYTRKLFSFSDCAFIIYKHKDEIEDSQKDIIKLAQTALLNTSILTIELLLNGYLIRGGATLGDAYFDNLSFFGPAINDSYILESKHADTPRVLISNELGEMVYDFEVKTYQALYNPLNPIYKILPKKTYNPTIVQKYESNYILNYCYILEDSGSFSSPRLNEISFNYFKSTVLASIEEKISGSRDEKILKKLNWIKNYITASRLAIDPDTGGSPVTVTV